MCVCKMRMVNWWWQREEEEKRRRERLLSGRSVDLFAWIMCIFNKSYHLGKAWTAQTCMNHECQNHHLWFSSALNIFFQEFVIFYFPLLQDKRTPRTSQNGCADVACKSSTHYDWHVGGWGCLGDTEIQNALHSLTMEKQSTHTHFSYSFLTLRPAPHSVMSVIFVP